MLTVARRIVEAEKYVQDGQWKSWGPYLLSGKDVHGSTVGIYGMGDIGKSFARRLQGFNTTILYHNRSRHEDAESELNASYVSFDTLLEERFCRLYFLTLKLRISLIKMHFLK